MKKQLQIWVGLGLAGAILYYMFRGTDWAAVWAALRGADPVWLLATLLILPVTFLTRVQRWTYIVRTAKPLPFRPMYSATQIGFLANFTLPGRVGEVIRAFVLARLGALPFPRCMAFVALDRITDLFGLMTMLLVTAVAFRPEADVQLPPGLLETPISAVMIRMALASTAAAAAVLIVAFAVLYVAQDPIIRIVRFILRNGAFANKVADLTAHFASGLHVFRSAGDVAKAIAWSLLTWVLCGVSYQTCMWAFGLDPPWYAPAIVMAVLSIVISLPGAPGFVGQFQLGIMVPVLLVMPDTPLDTARAIGIAAHIINLIPIAGIGLWCVYRENFGLMQLRRDTEAAGHGEQAAG